MNKFFIQILNCLEAKSPLYIKAKILPKSPKNEIIEQMSDETYKIRISAPATNGKANAELIKFLRKSLKVDEIKIISGQKDRTKLLKIN